MTTWHALVASCCGAGLLLLGAASAIACDPDEIKVGGDRYFDYCIKKTDVTDCKRKGGNVNKCVHTACRVQAGSKLSSGLADCREQSSICAGELGVPSTVIGAVLTCLAGSAVANPETCWVAIPAGAAATDVALATCRAKYGRCVEPVLKEQKDFNTYCDRYHPVVIRP
ncbi:MAG: hypothetical protein JO157_07075 [Acetobacteraceae bacterium]|nr:hypothetical protein [Acetobacteraceae bacterium]